jgi:hypothetical protein
MDYQIAVPSYRRADRVRVFDSFPQATVYVPESQYDDYAAHYGAERLISIPDAIDGDISRKLNWMIEHRLCDHWCYMDDDVYGFGRWQHGRRSQMTADECHEFILDGFRMCEESGCRMWGVNIINDKRAYSVFSPFQLLAPIPGPFSGQIMDHGIRYDPAMGVKQDYDFWLQMIAKYRRTFRFNQVHYLKKEEAKGGAYSYRTMEKERAWAAAIVKKWGRVIRYDEKRKNILDPRISIPIPGC